MRDKYLYRYRQSDSKCLQLIRRIRKENPLCVLAVSGCMTQAYPQLSEKLSECDIIVGSGNKTRIPEMDFSVYSDGTRIVEIPEHKLHGKNRSNVQLLR